MKPVIGLTLIALLACSGCQHYAEFTLMPTSGGDPRLTLAFDAQAAPVLSPGEGWESHDVLNPSVILNPWPVYPHSRPEPATSSFPLPLLLFYSGYDGHTWHTGLASSDDGLHWQKRGKILSPDPRTWEGSYIAANGSAEYHANQIWYWYVAGPEEKPSLGLARSTDTRTWRKEPRPVLEPGPYGSWDEQGVADPYVFRDASYFYMYYLGQDRARRQRLGAARSSDGIHWEKLRSNPILELGGTGAFDEAGLGEPAVWNSNGFYWMLYTGLDLGTNRRLGLARSGDGVHWEKLPAVFAGSAAWDSKVVCDPTVFVEGATIRVWFGGGDVASRDANLHGQIGAAILRRVTPQSLTPRLQCYVGEVNVGITCYPTYGGSGIVATELGLELALRGHEVHFITYANPIRLDPGTPRIHYHEVEVSNYPLFQYPPYCLALASRMAEVAESYDLDLLHVHYAIPHSISAMLAQQMLRPVRRLPFITTLHGTDITLVGTDRSYFPITKFSIEQSDGITSISDYLKTQTIDVFGVGNEIRVIHNFVNCERYQPDDAKPGAALYAPAGEKLLIHLSNFRPVKRVQDCVRILAEVRKSVPAHLLMVGDGPERGPAEHLARELKVYRNISFLGKQDHVERLIPLAHVLLMPSELESFGLVALEAMACGVVPVATRVGGVPELVTHGEDGFLEAVGDVAGQSARVVELLSDEDLHYRMRKAGRWNAAERFCTDRIIPQYEKHYEDVLRR